MARRGVGRTIVRVLVAVAALLVVLVIGLVVALQSSAVSNRVKELVLPRASAAVGREVTVRDARLRLFPHPRVELTGAAVAGRPGEPALVELDTLRVSLRAWPLLRSLGKEIVVEGVALVKPVVNLVRAPDGTWNYQGLGGSRASEPAQPAPADPARTVVVSHATIEDGAVRIVERGSGAASVAISQIGLTADHVGVGQPLEARLSAAVAGDRRNLDGRIRVSSLPASVADLGPGRYPALDGELRLAALDLAQLRAFLPPSVTGMMTGGRVDAEATLATSGERYHLDGRGRLSDVRLRGEPAQGGFELHAVADPGAGAARANLEHLVLKGPGVDLGGRATVELPPLKVRFAIAGPLLDLGQVMSLAPAQPAQPKPPGLQLTAAQRQTARALDVRGTVDVQRVVKGALVVNGLKATAALEHGAFVLQQAEGELFGGRVDASGTRFDLAPALPTWNLKARLDAVDLGQALTALAGSAPLLGRMTGQLDLDGAGVDWPTLRQALTGTGAVALKEGELTTTDLGGKVLGAVAAGLRAAGQRGAAGQVGGVAGKTSLRDLAAQFAVEHGTLALSKPLGFGAAFGTASLGGRIGLDGHLDLKGAASVTKQALAGLVPSGLPLPDTLAVPLGMGGSLQQPTVEVDAGQAVASLVSGAAERGAKQLQQKAGDEAQRAARRGLGDLLRGLGGK